MKRPVSPDSERERRRTHPIDGGIAGWFFRVTEVSAGVYLAEGVDLYGRKVSRTGANPDEILEQCVADAASLAAP